jgi:4-amino-4-deoxychorismate lyase
MHSIKPFLFDKDTAMLLIDGKPGLSVSVNDRSFQYGDGCFSTMLTLDGQLQHWPYHQLRLEACLDMLQIPFPNWNLVRQWINQVICPESKAGVKIHISRGQGGRGYSPNVEGLPTVTIQSFLYPEQYNQWIVKGSCLGICRQKLGINPLLAGHKHNNRLEQILLRSEMVQRDCADGVVLDIDDRIIETTMANLFWFRDERLYTPELGRAGVAGVMRKIILEVAGAEKFPVCVGDFSLEDLLSADEIFMTNSILRVAPVVQIEESVFPIGKKTRYFQEKVNAC